MEYILIGDEKIKVMLEKKDMEYYDISAIDIDYENAGVRRAFRRILEDVKIKTGFDMTAEQVLVQVYPCRDGGCEMFLTKLKKTKEANEEYAAYPKEITMLSVRPTGYLFPTLESLISILAELRHRGGYTQSSLLFTDRGQFLLLLEEKITSGTKRNMPELGFLEEFAEKKKSALQLTYIKEHSTTVLESNAVEMLLKWFR